MGRLALPIASVGCDEFRNSGEIPHAYIKPLKLQKRAKLALPADLNAAHHRDGVNQTSRYSGANQ